jgi:ATP-dependent helicase HrpA
MTAAHLLHAGVEKLDPADYPDAMFVRSMRLPFEYYFGPDAARDGVTVCVPRDGFAQLDPKRLDWLVPGLLREKVLALLKTLPKELRRKLIPAVETAQQVAGEIGYANGSFAWAVARALSKIAGESIPPDLLDFARLPPHLRMRVRVIDAGGRTVAASRDLAELRRRLSTKAQPAPPVYDVYLDGERWNREGITTWDFGELPDEIELPEGRITLVGFPAVVDRQDSVSLELMPSPESAQRESRAGIRRLVMLACADELASQVKWLPNLPELLLHGGTLPQIVAADPRNSPGGEPRNSSHAGLRGQLAELIADRAFFNDDPLPHTLAEFESLLARGRQRLGLAVQETVELVGPLFQAYHQTRQAIEAAQDPSWKYAVADMVSQLGELTRPGFLTATPGPWLQHFPRYFQAIRLRLENLAAGGLEADEQRFALIHPRWQNLLERLAEERAERHDDPEWDQYRWLVEEFRVSLFARQLGTAVPISEKRLDAQWERVARGA